MVEAPGSIATWCDRLLDGVVVVLATWTVVYHVCLVTRLGSTSAVVLETVVLAVTVGALRRRPSSTSLVSKGAVPPSGTPTDVGDSGAVGRGLLAVTTAAALVAAIAMALAAAWAFVWIPWLVAAVAGSLWAGRWLVRHPRPASTPPPVGEGWTGVGVLAWALGLGLWSLWTLAPDPDDLFYVNLSEWVARHGEFPIQDTLFSNLRYPMSNWPPVASYDGLIGVVARLTGAHAATVEYVVVTPLATFLAVLALWRLLRAWRVGHSFWVLSTALVFLLFDGASYASPGNLFLTRLWQGKILLLCIVVPVLLAQGLRYVERPLRSRVPPLALGGIAAVGLTTTGIFLVPILAVGVMAPLALRDRSRALLGFLALALYPLAAGAVTLAIGGRAPDDFGSRRSYRFDASWIGSQILFSHLVGFVVVVAMLLGALLVPHPEARLTSGILVLATGYVFVPGAMRASYDLSGLGPTLWRISWAASVAALVGVLAGHGLSRVTQPVLRRRSGLRSWQRWDTPLACLVVMGLLAGFGRPIWSAESGAEIRSPFHWQRSYSSRHVAAAILAVTSPGDLVLAPDPVSITIAVTTTDVKTVAPRDYYLDYLQDVPSFHYRQRLKLVRYVNDDIPGHVPGIAEDLDLLRVDVACTLAGDEDRSDTIAAAGFRPLLTTPYYRCLIRD
jgi:Family of unknown function (DUF6077)